MKSAFKHAVTLQAAGYPGMTAETLVRVYGHHHPDHLKGAVEAAGRGGRAPVKAKAL